MEPRQRSSGRRWYLFGIAVLVLLLIGLGWFAWQSSQRLSLVERELEELRGATAGTQHDVDEVAAAVYNLTKAGLALPDEDLLIPSLHLLRIPSGSGVLNRVYDLVKEEDVLTSDMKLAIADFLWGMQEHDVNDPFLGSCDPDDWRTGEWAGYYQFFTPVVGCETVYRAGIQGDGGKYLCNIHKILRRSDCVVLSFGTERDLSFDNQMHHLLGCFVHAFDPTVQRAEIQSQLSDHIDFHPYGIGPGRNGGFRLAGRPLFSLEDIAVKENITHAEIMKIDVEGAELSTFRHMFEEEHDILQRLGVKLILVEYHAPSKAFEGGRYDCRNRKTHLYPFIKLFYDHGYLMFQDEHNVYVLQGTLCCMEYAFISRDFV